MHRIAVAAVMALAAMAPPEAAVEVEATHRRSSSSKSIARRLIGQLPDVETLEDLRYRIPPPAKRADPKKEVTITEEQRQNSILLAIAPDQD